MQIMEEIDKAPPLQQRDVARRYEGIKVDWELLFLSASPMPKDNALVLLTDSESFSLACVRRAVKLPLYREMAIMKRGKRIRVVGTLFDVDGPFITLKEVKLTY